jgi:spore germination cell wall hydrolase CwlJ-like protein
MDDQTLLALCLWSEASGEPLEGKQAAAQVVLNRMRLHYMSDGTVPGTVLYPNQFSGFYFDFRDGKYTRVCWSRDDAEHHAEAMLLRAQHQAVWDVCLDVAIDALDGDMPLRPELERAVLYLNPAILPRLPAWASPAKQLCAIGRHTFYEA